MEHIEKSLLILNYTQYEIKVFRTLLTYSFLDANMLAKYSKIPQPKIYETIEKLSSRGLVEKLISGKKTYFKIRPRHVIHQILQKNIDEIHQSTQNLLPSIDSIYGTQDIIEIPLIGISGKENIEDSILSIIENAQKNLIMFFPSSYYTPLIINTIQKKVNDNLSIQLILHTPQDVIFNQSNTNIERFLLQTPAFDIFPKIMLMIQKAIPEQIVNSFMFQVLSTLMQELRYKFGLMVVDEKKSLFIIPFPTNTPIGFICSFTEMVDFHLTGLKYILSNASIKIYPNS